MIKSFLSLLKPLIPAVAILLTASALSASAQTPASDTAASKAAPATAATAAPATTPATAAPVGDRPTIRIDAGSSTNFTDSKGNIWLADTGFADGDTVERPDAKVTNTTEAGLFRSEHYSMTSFSKAVANGKYLVKLYFAETFDDVTTAGQRVFTVTVQGKEIKDLDVVAKAGGPLKAYIESVPAEVTDGTLKITFTAGVQNPEINAIEILPQ